MRIPSKILVLPAVFFFIVSCSKEPRPDSALDNPTSASDTVLKNTALYYRYFGTADQKVLSLCNLGQRYVEQGCYSDALEVYRQAERIPHNELSEIHLELLRTYELELLEFLPGSLDIFHPKESDWFKNTLITLLIIQLITIILMIVQSRKQKKQDTELKKLYDELLTEYNQIKNLPFLMSDLPPVSGELLEKKIRALGTFFTHSLPDSLEIVTDQLDSLTQNRKELLETVGMLYATYHPGFVSRLLGCKLTTLEVGYCSLLVTGLRTGEMKDIINRSGVYNINVVIRRKLDIETNSTTLSSCLRKIYSETEG